jgi:hypothetical protein
MDLDIPYHYKNGYMAGYVGEMNLAKEIGWQYPENRDAYAMGYEDGKGDKASVVECKHDARILTDDGDFSCSKCKAYLD